MAWGSQGHTGRLLLPHDLGSLLFRPLHLGAAHVGALLLSSVLRVSFVSRVPFP